MEAKILKGEVIHYEDSNLASLVLDKLRSDPDLEGQIEAATGESQTYKIMLDRSIRCALWMKSQGVGPGDVVAVCSRNQLDVPLACFATLYLGAAVNPLDEEGTDDFRHLLNLVKPKMAFVSKKAVAALAEAARDVNLELKMIVFGRVCGFLEFEDVIIEPGASEVEGFRCASIKSEEIAFIMCSSGTTGVPKAIALSHDALLKQIYILKKLGSGNRYLCFTAICWIAGVFLMFANLIANEAEILNEKFDEGTACNLIEKYKPKRLFLGSGLINRLLESNAIDKYDCSSLELVLYGGAPLAISSRQHFSKLLTNAVILSSYGMTEVSGISTVQSIDSKPGSCGRIIANTQLKVVDVNTGETLGVNEKGELLLKTPSMMKSYFNNPKATAETIDEQGWLHSGDLGYYDEDGEIWVVERLKELIKYRGHHVSPFEIESVISSHPAVKEVAVVSSPHPVDVEHPVAFVVKALNYNGAVDDKVIEKELIDLVAAKLSDDKRLRGGVRFVDHLFKTPGGKIGRRKLNALMRSSETVQVI